MTLDVETPDPPELESVDPNEYEDAEVGGDEYHRSDLETFLAEGAWEEAFDRWATDSEMAPSTWHVVEELELIAQFDFFWRGGGRRQLDHGEHPHPHRHLP